MTMDERSNEASLTGDSNGAPPEGSPSETTDGGWAFTEQAHYDPTEPRDLTTVIIRTIAEAEGVPMVEITPPLYEVVDIAGIDGALFGRPDTSKEGTDSAVEFRYNGYKVRVEADGWVTVLRPSNGTTTDEE